MQLEALRQRLSQAGYDALIVTKEENLAYLSGFTGGEATLLISAHEALLFTDFRYIEQAEAEAPEFTVVRTTLDPLAEIGGAIVRLGAKRVAFEAADVRAATYARWQSTWQGQFSLEATEHFVEGIRLVKTTEEVVRLRRAARLADEAFEHILPFVREGAIERDIALELEFFMRRGGAEAAGFDFIVASGQRGSLPHGKASSKRVARGDLVTMDYGCFVDGYTSDTTRTVAVGEPSAKLREIYRIVFEAQEAGVAAVKPGLRGCEVDAVSRGLIAAAGYGDFFGHGLGHGVGREIHEEPRLSLTGDKILAPGMVVTVEPGIYLPGEGGVRIEDMVLVTEGGGERLTTARRELVTL